MIGDQDGNASGWASASPGGYGYPPAGHPPPAGTPPLAPPLPAPPPAHGGGSPPPGGPGNLRPASAVAMMTIAAIIGLTPLLLASGIGSAFIGGDYGRRIWVVIILGAPGLVASFWFTYWAGNGVGLATFVAIAGLAVQVVGMRATEHAVLSIRGEEVVARVTERSAAEWGRSRQSRARCRLHTLDGTEVRPRLGGSDCFGLEAGQTVWVMADPDGKMGPVLMDRYDRGGNIAAMVVVAVIYAGMLVLAAVLGRRSQRATQLARWRSGIAPHPP